MATTREQAFDLLRQKGMTTIFGNPGSTEMGFLNEFPDDFRYILGLQEAAVVSMADGYAQATGTTTLVNLHSAPGLGNAMGSIVNARANRSPLVITAGTQTREMAVMEALLTNVDATTLPRPAVKWSYETPRPQDAVAVLARGIHVASSAPAGPVFISQPMDDWDASADETATQLVTERTVTAHPQADPAELDQVAQLLNKARNPLLIVGAPLDTEAGWTAATTFAEQACVAVMIGPCEGRLAFPGWHPNFRGTLAPAIALAAQQMAGHDLVLVVGAPVFRYYPFIPGPLLPEGTTLVQITDDVSEAARAPMGEAIVGDPIAALTYLSSRCDAAGREQLQSPPAPEAPAVASPMSAANVYATLAQVLPDDVVIVNESPSNLTAFNTFIRPKQPKSFYFSASGGLGFGMSATVGVQLGTPGRPVVGVIGDGSAHYSIQGMYTAALYNIPCTWIVLRNTQYGILKWFAGLEQVSGIPGLDLPHLDAVAAAQAYGVSATRVDNPDDLTAAVRNATASGSPHLIEVLIDSSTDVL